MRRLRTTALSARLSLLVIAALLAGALPGAAHRAAAQTPPGGGAPAATATPAAPATPALSLPTGEVAAEPRTLAEALPGEKTRGLMPGDVSFGAANPVARLADLSTGCANLSVNGPFQAGFDAASNPIIYDWVEITPTLALRGDEFVSYPYSVAMSDRDELDLPNDGLGGGDDDWFGQDFDLPAETRSILIDFSVKYPAFGDVGLDVDTESYPFADKGYIELYLVDDNGDLVDSNPSTQILDGAIIWRLDRVFERDEAQAPGTQTNRWWRLINPQNDLPYDPTTNPFGDPEAFATLRGNRVALVFSQLGDKLAPHEEPILDNVQVIACPQPDQPKLAIEGNVTHGGVSDAAISTASMALLYSADGVGEELIRSVTPRTDGFYSFTALPSLGPGGYYQVLYIKGGLESENDDPLTTDDDRLAYYAGPRVTADTVPIRDDGLSTDYAGGDFDLRDVSLLSPEHLAEVAGDVTYSWTASPIPGARYIVCFFDPDADGEHCLKPTAETSLTLGTAALQAAWPGFAFGRYLGWYVRIAGPGYDESNPVFADLGASGYSSYLKFLAQAEVVPAPPAAEEQEPPAPDGAKDWTLMFYMAGDDEDLTSPPGFARSMQDMVPALIGLADRHPNVNIVVQFDFYESDQSPLAPGLRGTQFCYFKPGVRLLAQLCQQLGERSMAAPQTLSDFVTASLAKYPADRTALIIMGHGSPVAGVAGDRTGADDAMDPTELEQALAGANLNRKLDALVFYNCLMGSYEVASLAARYADYMVASPNIATLIDINAQIVAQAGANPDDPRAFATGVVAAYDQAMRSYNALYSGNSSIAMAAYDLARIGALAPLVDSLAQALIANLTREEVGAARARVQEYDGSAPVLWGFNPAREDALVDLGNLAALLATSPNAAVSGAATSLLTALGAPGAPGSLVIASVARSGAADMRAGGTHSFAPGAATGLSIYFPNGSNQGEQIAMTRLYLLYYRQLSFGAGTWDELVDATRTGLPSLPRGIRLGGLAGAPGSTLQNLAARTIFPPAASMPGGSAVHLPLITR